MQKTEQRPILIIQTAFIGDTILASRFMHQVSEAYPGAAIHVVVRKGNESVIQGLPFVHKVWIWHKKKGLQKHLELFRLIKELRKHHFHTSFNLQRYFSTGWMSLWLKSDFKVGFKQNPLSWFFTHAVNHQIPHVVSGQAWHEVQRNFQLLQKVKPLIPWIQDPKKWPPLLPSYQISQKLMDYIQASDDRPYVVIAPASVWFTKQWPVEAFAELTQRLQEKFRVYLIGGPDDVSLCDNVKGQTSAINLAGKCSLLESAELMRKAHRVVVNDSGPLHLASAVGAPTTAIFCATIPEFGYGPLSSDSTIIQVEENLKCRPCGLHGGKTCPEKHFDCGRKITVESVVQTIV